MKKFSVVAIFIAVVALQGVSRASGEVSTGALFVTGTIESSISLTIESAGGTATGTGTGTVNTALGSMSRFSAAPLGFTMARGLGNWTVTSNVGVQVVKSNLISPSYTLTAQLGSAPLSGVTWKLNGSTLNDGLPTTLTTTGAYGVTFNCGWDITVADSAAAASIDNTIVFTAVAN